MSQFSYRLRKPPVTLSRPASALPVKPLPRALALALIAFRAGDRRMIPPGGRWIVIGSAVADRGAAMAAATATSIRDFNRFMGGILLPVPGGAIGAAAPAH